jgi:lipopolysaccharide/colanic/teichoic acid biosynthesis glycosyltransferase
MAEEQLGFGELAFAGSSLAGAQGPLAGVKRAADITEAFVGILLCTPFMITTAVLIKLDSRGPALFMQERVGKDGKTFRMYKFRTMVDNTEEMLDQLIDVDSLDEPVFKIRNDPRVTSLGRFLRRWIIDELPQLFNVLKGEMSLVGPRPEEVRIARHYNQWHRTALMVKPGLTGPVQVGGRGNLNLAERVRLDIEYICNHSLSRDLRILLRTIPAVIRGNGSY